MRALISRLPKQENGLFWVLLAFLIRFCFFAFKVSTESDTTVHYPGTFASEAGDTISYFEPIDNLLRFGRYFDDHRMPGYGWVYLVLRLFLPATLSLNGIACLQLALASISVYVLAKLAAKAFGNGLHFYGVFLAFAFSTYTALWDHVLLAESFCTSALIFSLYLLIDAKNSKWRLLLSGLLLTWSVFLRPVTAPLLGLYALHVLFKNLESRARLLALNWKAAVVFLVPFLLLDGLWTVRNFRAHKGFYPLMTTIAYKGERESYLGALTRFVQAFGGSTVWWAPGAEMTYFIPLPAHIKAPNTTGTLPQFIYTSQFNQESLMEVRSLVGVLLDKGTSRQRRQLIESEVVQRLDSYTASIKEEKPLLFHFLSRLRITKSFFVHSGTYNLFNRPCSELNVPELAVKIFYSLFYVIVVLSGLVGSALLLFERDIDCALLSLSTLFLALVHPLIFKMDEFRYLAPGYPFLLLAAVFCWSASLKALSAFRAKGNPAGLP